MEKKTQRGIITAAVVLVAVAVAMKFILPKKSIGGGNNSGGGNAGGGNSGGFTPVNTNLDFRSLANQLFDSFDGYGTENDKIKEIFKLLKSNNDYNALKAAYGVREVSSGRFNIFQSNFEGDLPATIKDELDSDELAEVNEILARNGLTITI